MYTYRCLIKIKVGSAITTTHIEIDAQNANIAKAVVAAQYGSNNVLNIIRKQAWQGKGCGVWLYRL